MSRDDRATGQAGGRSLLKNLEDDMRRECLEAGPGCTDGSKDPLIALFKLSQPPSTPWLRNAHMGLSSVLGSSLVPTTSNQVCRTKRVFAVISPLLALITQLEGLRGIDRATESDSCLSFFIPFDWFSCRYFPAHTLLRHSVGVFPGAAVLERQSPGL